MHGQFLLTAFLARLTSFTAISLTAPIVSELNLNFLIARDNDDFVDKLALVYGTQDA
jgi:hypothetical protein